MNIYADVITILENATNAEPRKILVEIAKANPAAVKRAFKAIDILSHNKKIIDFAKNSGGKKISTIKFAMELTGKGLKECKELVEDLYSF